MSEGTTELLTAVRRVVAAFESLGVDYLIGGSVASSVLGEPRQTLDADLVAKLLGRHAAPLANRLHDGFYADLAAITTAIQTQGCFNVIHLDTMVEFFNAQAAAEPALKKAAGQ